MLATSETATMQIMQIKKDVTSRRYAAVNHHLQLDEWAHKEMFVLLKSNHT